MFNLRTTRRRATTHRLLILLALFALAGTACSDDANLPVDLLNPDGDEAAEPAEDPSEEASEPASDEPADDAAADEPADDAAAEEPADDTAAVDPITADDVAEVCADEEARATTANELAPLVGLSPETFESVACSSVE